MIDISYVELTNLRKNFYKLNRELSKNINFVGRTVADKTRNIARGAAPVKTGHLKNSIVSMKVKTGKNKVNTEYRIISKKPIGARVGDDGFSYNVYQEYGIYPNPEFGYVPGYGMVRWTPKKHPGFKGKHFMEHAFRWAEKEFPRKVLVKVDEVMNKVLAR